MTSNKVGLGGRDVDLTRLLNTLKSHKVGDATVEEVLRCMNAASSFVENDDRDRRLAAAVRYYKRFT